MSERTIAVTVGEPAGIGPDLCLELARHRWPCRIVLLGDRFELALRAAALAQEFDIPEYRPDSPVASPVSVWHHPLARRVRPGELDPANAMALLAALDTAVAGCLAGRFAAMVTAPVSKAAINEAGIPFTGHTEYLAARTGGGPVVMLLVGGGLRVALATTHLALSAVPAALTREGLVRTLAILDRDLSGRFGVSAPRIGVCGLNPHAGEGGHLGREEIEVIAPAIAAAVAAGIRADGPHPADTIFVPRHSREYDAILAMYHDQGLPTLKAASFGHAVNVTLGLPYPRTSVDHGTALDLAADAAGARTADDGSLHEAVLLAIAIASRAA